ncbi:Rv3235 family protein [Streptomyces sp. NPDC020801]|uniref:Rv3235 family protein n=1 Tax=unclassified Streptomyces TaxID=2593676 RepID=UPI00378CD73A
MNKVMTRIQRRPGTRPPGRHDARRPGGPPPRTPDGARSRTPGDGRPPGAPGGRPPARTGPTDTRPGAGPGRSDTRGARAVSAGGTATATAAQAAQAVAQAAQAAPRTAPHPVTTDLFADRLLAVLSGQRPVHWMLRHTAGRAYDELARLAERGPLRTRGARPVVRDIGYYEPRPGALEAFARIGAGDQLRAMAFRLELGRDLRWRCTAVELGGPRTPRTDDD